MKNILSVLTLLTVLMSSVSAQDTVQVFTGWNIIGSLGSGIDPSDLVSVPPGIIVTAMYGYNPGAGYESATALEKGKGYWLKVSADGIIIFSGGGIPGPCGTKTVVYGGKTYYTIQIGSRCWLRQNLDVGVMIARTSNQTDNGAIEKYCYNNEPVNCALYGGLYQWDEAMQYAVWSGLPPGARGICPSGWHLPSRADLEMLASSVGGDGNALKAVGQGSGDGAGSNTSGFSALIAGYRNPGGFYGLGSYVYFWSSTENDATNASSLRLFYLNSLIYDDYSNFKNYGFSVRCLED